MRDRLRPPKEYDDILNKLKEDGVFATRQKAIMFAASLGFKLEPDSEVQPLEGYGEGIPISIFSRATDSNFIDALAVTKVNSLQVLQPEKGDERLEVFEHFARIGLERINKSCYQGGAAPLQGILDLIDQFQDSSESSDKLPGLESSAQKLGRMM